MTITPMRQHLHHFGGYRATAAASDHHIARPTFLSVSEPNADSVLEDRQVQASRMAPISAIPVRQSELGQKGAGRWVRGWQEEGSGFTDRCHR